MISKSQEKEKAVKFRKQGWSYSEILQQIPVAKSTLSLWLHSVGLSKKQKQRLTKKKLAAMKRGSMRCHAIRMERWKAIKEKAVQEINNISEREKWFLGIALYWAEGSKEKEYTKATNLKFSNSDPLMIKFFQKWLLEFLNLKSDDLRYELYIHKKADWQKAKMYWINQLGIDSSKIKVYFKKYNPNSKRKNVNDSYKGLIRICVLGGGVDLFRKIDGWVCGILKNCRVV